MGVAHGFELLREARKGSPDAISELFGRYGPKLHASIRARLGPQLRRRVESRDILQVTPTKAFQGFHRFDGDGSSSFTGWLGAIVRAEICDQADLYECQERGALPLMVFASAHLWHRRDPEPAAP